MKRLIPLLLFFCIAANSFSQRSFKAAEKKFNEKEYFSAIDLYKLAYKDCDKDLKPECLWKLAECYRLIGDPKQAKILYEKAIKAGCTQTDQAKIYLADSTLLRAFVRIPPSARIKVTPDTLYRLEKDSNVAIISPANFQVMHRERLDAISPAEIKELGTLLFPCLTSYKNFLEDLAEYRYQCVPVINDKGEKLIFVNAFHWEKNARTDWQKNWRKYLIEVDDGGNYFFHFYIDLKNKTCLNFRTNGPG